ncbi:MAG: hypothetical protein U0872_12885 [Planctomycetaceae bacterium]
MLTLLVVAGVGGLANQRLAEYSLAETEAKQKFAAMESPHHYDAIIIGTSIATYGVDPRSFPEEGRYYNFSLPGAAGRMTRVVVDRFLDAGNTAQYVLFEVNPLTFDPAHAWRRPYHDIDALSRRHARELQQRAYGPASLETWRFVGETFPLWSRRAPAEWFFFGIDSRDTIAATEDQLRLQHYALGYVPLEDRPIPPGELARPVRYVNSRKNPVVRKDVEAVETLIARLQAAGSTVILFEAPVCGHQTIGEPYEQYRREIDRIAQQFHLAHLNYREQELTSDTSDREPYFWDRTHLSRSGATCFSRELWRDVQASLANGDAIIQPVKFTAAPDEKHRH